MSKYIVTSALPYANGKLHIGHVAGAYLPADIFVRFLKLQGEDVIYVCGTDEHGAPISIKAEKENVTPQDIVNRYHESIKNDFDGLNFNFDNFSGTARPAHHKLAQKFFKRLCDNGFIDTQVNQQYYCEHDKRFLADRYVEGVCPHCGEPGARGDQCDECGKLIDAVSLKNPECKICGNSPIIKDTKHWFLKLPAFEDQLRNWLKTKDYWKSNVYNFIMNWLNEGLIDRAVTRDIDWGIKLPIENTEGKVLYVWFDAPIGYISSTVEWAEKMGKPDLWKEYWEDPSTKLIHFIGKDNIPFHTIIWPAVLMGQKSDYVLPYDVPANEYLNLESKQLSTSRNWAIWAEDFLKYFDGELLRYVLAVNAPETKDSDFTWKDFQSRVNNELANILGNLANRTFVFAKKYFDSRINKPDEMSEKSKSVLAEVEELSEEVKHCFYNYRVRKAVKTIMDIARIGNKTFDENQPWKTVKNEDTKDSAEETICVCAEILRRISILLTPVMPETCKKLRNMMNLEEAKAWNELNDFAASFAIGETYPLFAKIEDEQIEEQIKILEEKSKENEPRKLEGRKEEVQFDDFMKVELRVVKITEAEKVKKSKKLIKLKVKAGDEERVVLSGIKANYNPEELVGKKVVMLFNLPPRKMMGTESQGMILAAENGDELSLLVPDRDIPDGSLIS
ncbi:MAG: methionine--tRNA ligase [Candidatus Cloacimonadota bacterium]|nr:MAG: methionine--tRNA ligase [Candidatus Cloacimonadota bacterium]